MADPSEWLPEGERVTQSVQNWLAVDSESTIGWFYGPEDGDTRSRGGEYRAY